jgi:hypothetical protein
MKRYGLMSKVLEGKLTLAAAKPANFRKNVPSPQDWVLIFKRVGKVRAFSSAMRGIFSLSDLRNLLPTDNRDMLCRPTGTLNSERFHGAIDNVVVREMTLKQAKR